MHRKVLQSATLAAAVITACSVPAHAYLDPGTGSYIIQIVIAGVLGAAITIKAFWLRIKGFFSRVFSKGARND